MIPKKVYWEFLKYIKLGMNVSDSCRKAGISRDTYYKWLKIPEKAKEIKEAEIDCIYHAHLSITKGMVKDAKWGAWVLEHKRPNEYGKKIKITGAVANLNENTTGLTAEEIKRKLDEYGI